MKKMTLTALAVAITAGAFAQELYPNSEPASVTPKHSLGIRLMNEAYTSDGKFKSWHGAMFMYGISPKFMVKRWLRLQTTTIKLCLLIIFKKT